jgi:hypothetical protein
MIRTGELGVVYTGARPTTEMKWVSCYKGDADEVRRALEAGVGREVLSEGGDKPLGKFLEGQLPTSAFSSSEAVTMASSRDPLPTTVHATVANPTDKSYTLTVKIVGRSINSEEIKANARKFVADDGTVTYDMRTGFLPCAGYGRSIEGYSDFDLYGYNGATCEDIKGVCGDADPACGAGGATNADTGCSVVEVECCCPCENWYDWFFSSAFLFVLCCCLGGGFAVKKATKKKEKGGDEEQGDDDTSSG